MLLLKEFSKKINFEKKNQQTSKLHAKSPVGKQSVNRRQFLSNLLEKCMILHVNCLLEMF